jgi:hypothetical protein
MCPLAGLCVKGLAFKSTIALSRQRVHRSLDPDAFPRNDSCHGLT